MDLIHYNFQDIPEELKQKPQWILWKSEERGNGKFTKIPYQIDGNEARSNDRSTWSTFATANKFYNESNADGIGFVFSKQDDFIGIDIDKCITYKPEDTNRFNPILSDLAKDIIETLDSYTEISCSGTGIHIIVKGKLPDDICGTGRKSTKHNLELYRYGRYFTISGSKENSNDTIQERTDEIKEILDKYFDDSDMKQRVVKLSDYEKDEINLSNNELWEKIFNSKNGSEVKSLYDGKLINDDASSSDMSLCNHLAFWTGNSASRIDSMFRESNLMRDKWDRITYGDTGETYGERTISKAIAATSSTVLDYKSLDKEEYIINYSKKIVEKDLEKLLKQRHWDEMKILENEWIAAGEKGRKPISLSPKHCADILKQYINFVIFDLEENTRLAMYLSNEGIYTTNTQHIKRIISWIEPSLNDSKANDVIYFLTNEVEIKPKTESRFLIPVNNGIFNLKTKKLEEFTHEYVFTSKITTNYNENANNKKIDDWDLESWIDSISCNDEEISNLLWQVINESLNGNYTRKKSIFLLGDGNNGKGTFQELLINLIGQNNIASLRVNEFDERFKLSMLEGKTLVIGDDVQAGVNIDDSANFNSVVTGDRVAVEQKNKPIYSTNFRCTVIQSTNGMPTFKNKTSGTIRRIIIVPFNADFNGQHENMNIKDVYIKDKDILEYALYKSINMNFEKFSIPESSLKQIEEFKIDNDPIEEFNAIIFKELPFKEIPKKYLYELYVSFCKDNGYEKLTNRKFFKEFKKKINDKWIDNTKRFSYEELKELSNFFHIYGIEEWKKDAITTLKIKGFKIVK